MSSTAKIVVALVIALIVSNGYWLLEIKDIKIKQEQEKTKQAEDYAKKVEYQHELTKSSIETVTEETNHYMYINEQLQENNNALQNELDKILQTDECANTNIPDDVRSRLFTTH